MTLFTKKRRYADGHEFAALELERYFIDFVPGSRNTLFITFENADKPKRPRLDACREPWGFRALNRAGYSVLGIKPKAVDWYRGRDLHEFFRSALFASFSESFQQIVLYGSSMGGYGALTFAAACPGSRVIAINPQSTLNPALVPWEDRYPEGKAQDWLGDFADGATGAACASSVLVAYDPLFALDRRHVERLSPGNLVELKTPLLRHSLPSWLVEMGVLKEVVTRFAEGGLDNADCRALARKRRTIPRYYASMMVRTRSRAVARRCLDLLLDKPHLGTEARYDIILALRAHEMWTDAACVCLTLAERGAAFSVELACGIAQQLMERSNFALASELAHAALRRAPASLEGQVILAEVPYRSGDLATAAELTRKVILNHPQSGRPHRLLARIHWAAGRAGRAAASAADAVRFDPDNYLGHYERGVYLLALGRIESAAEALRMALAIQPTNRAAAEKLAACEARLAA